MSDAFIGEIRMAAFDFAPLGWAKCDGSELSKVQNQVLFMLIGSLYKQPTANTFFLPDLRGQVPISAGHYQEASGTINYQVGQSGGAETRTVDGLPTHAHAISLPKMAFAATGRFDIPATTTQTNGSAMPAAGAIFGPGTEPSGLDMLPYSSNAPDSTLRPVQAQTQVNITVAVQNVTSTTGAQPGQLQNVPTMTSYQALTYLICLEGPFPVQP